MKVDATEVVDVDVVEEEINGVPGAEAEAEAEDEVTTPIHYLFHMVMELLFMKLRYIINFNINNFPNQPHL